MPVTSGENYYSNLEPKSRRSDYAILDCAKKENLQLRQGFKVVAGTTGVSIFAVSSVNCH